ncbi:unnamed protein product [Adineta ricciae]|uniref:F-box domain-containing protein n=1 Tax=Adineta ricciae TaxID=249248 RepID=A0A816AS91_ADIRI|nr:unnamed protein product [Adineta ricciae]CAF1599496.1 unnamed protein product [Adineta ricciae]
MTTCAEQLPTEIWLMIFRYFEVHYIVQAFHSLNSYFNKILSSNHLSFYLRLKQADLTDPLFVKSIFHRTRYLECSIRLRILVTLQFLQSYSHQLLQLRKLSIHICRAGECYTSTICQLLKQIPHLEHLSLFCALDKTSFESILTIPTLKTCHLVLQVSRSLPDQLFTINHSIRKLHVLFLGSLDNQLIYCLLRHMPEVRQVKIFGSNYSFGIQTVFNERLFTLSNLRYLKVKFSNGNFNKDCFTELHSIMPCLRYFQFDYSKHILSQSFIDIFLSSWWPIIEQIPYIRINIKGHLTMESNDDNIQINIGEYRQKFLQRVTQSNKTTNVTWTDRDYHTLTYIEILIDNFSLKKI